VRRFPTVRLLVVGDFMLDQFIWGNVERISPEAPVPVVHVSRESFHLGGAANVVHNVRALGGHASGCGLVGTDSSGRRVVAELKKIGAGCAGIVAARGASTIRKTRVIAHNQQVVRFDRESSAESPAALARVCRFLRRRGGAFDAIVISDYGKGMVNDAVLDAVRAARARRRRPLVVDPKKPNFGRYHDITLASPNAAEAAEAAGMEIGNDQDLVAAGGGLLKRWGAEAVLVTRGEHGMTLVQPNRTLRHFPAAAREVYDVTGAGDTVVATCALALAVGASFEEAARLANSAAGIVVGKLGTATLSAKELMEGLRA
jgi:D-beta-D-heptose 7-phosphate kinase/D-beta-D-heptose 1-phosphate adenosyltransferase